MGDKEEKKKKNPAPAPKSAKRRKKKGPPAAVKIPAGLCFAPPLPIARRLLIRFSVVAVFPTSKCKLRLLKLERIKDYLLMEQEFIQNQELRKPREQQNDVRFRTIRSISGQFCADGAYPIYTLIE